MKVLYPVFKVSDNNNNNSAESCPSVSASSSEHHRIVIVKLQQEVFTNSVLLIFNLACIMLHFWHVNDINMETE